MFLARLTPGASREEREEIILQARKASELLKALSHETRLLILCILADGEKTVGEIEAILGLQQAVVSQQLARLRLEHLVETRRAGRLIHYRIGSSDVAAVISSLHDMFCAASSETQQP